MGEDKALICRDCEAYTAVDKLPFKSWEGMDSSERNEWFDNEYHQDVACKLMGFLHDHRECNVSLVGEYGMLQDEFFKASLEWDEEYDLF